MRINFKRIIPTALLTIVPSIVGATQFDSNVIDYVRQRTEKQNLYNVDFDSTKGVFNFSTWSENFDSLKSSKATTSREVETVSQIMGIFNALEIDDTTTQKALTYRYLRENADSAEAVQLNSLFPEIRNNTIIGWRYKQNNNEGFIPGLIKYNGHVQIFNHDNLTDPKIIPFKIPYEVIAEALQRQESLEGRTKGKKTNINGLKGLIEKDIYTSIFLPVEFTVGYNISGDNDKQLSAGVNFNITDKTKMGFNLGYPIDSRNTTISDSTELEFDGPYSTREIHSKNFETRLYDLEANLSYDNNNIRVGGSVGVSAEDFTGINSVFIPIYRNGEKVAVETDPQSIKGRVYHGKAGVNFGLTHKRFGVDLNLGVRGRNLNPYAGVRARFNLSPKPKTMIMIKKHKGRI